MTRLAQEEESREQRPSQGEVEEKANHEDSIRVECNTEHLYQQFCSDHFRLVMVSDSVFTTMLLPQ